MPRRPAYLSLQTAPRISSHLSTPPSPASASGTPRSPLSPAKSPPASSRSIPPLRLHFRSPLPPLLSPLSPRIAATAPRAPEAWIWRCHLCHSVYRLGVTRRCLEDGHVFCSGVGEREESEGGSGSGSAKQKGDVDDQEIYERKRRKAKKRAKKGVWCRAEFDYLGWSQYNMWRRQCQTYRFEKRGGSRTEDSHMEMELKGEKSCWDDCEYPSECNNTRWEEEMRRVRDLEWGDDELYDMGNVVVQCGDWSFGENSSVEEWERDIEDEKTRKYLANEAEDREVELREFEAMIELEREAYNAGCGNNGDEGTEEKTSVKEGVVSDFSELLESGLGMGSSGVVDELEDIYGAEFALKKRKKSIKKIIQKLDLRFGIVRELGGEILPKSPLKVEFTSNERDHGESEANSEIEDLQAWDAPDPRSDFEAEIEEVEDVFGHEVPRCV